eukprot:955869-Ditylum_brightwellii.AAC.1
MQVIPISLQRHTRGHEFPTRKNVLEVSGSMTSRFFEVMPPMSAPPLLSSWLRTDSSSHDMESQRKELSQEFWIFDGFM